MCRYVSELFPLKPKPFYMHRNSNAQAKNTSYFAFGKTYTSCCSGNTVKKILYWVVVLLRFASYLVWSCQDHLATTRRKTRPALTLVTVVMLSFTSCNCRNYSSAAFYVLCSCQNPETHETKHSILRTQEAKRSKSTNHHRPWNNAASRPPDTKQNTAR